jgi:hypothetical protein
MARRLGQGALIGRLVLRQVAEGLLGRGDLPELEQHAHALPDILYREALVFPQLVGELVAARGQLARLEPHRQPFVQRRFVAAQRAREPGIAADLQILAAEVRCVGIELLPVGTLAELLEPFGAQHLADVRVAIRGQEPVDLIGLRVLQAQREAPVLDPRHEQVLVELLRVPRQLHRVACAIGVERGEQRVVLGRAKSRRGT